MLILMAGAASASLGEAADLSPKGPPDALARLAAHDRALQSSSFTIHLRLETPVSTMLPALGRVTWDGSLFHGGEARGLILRATAFDRPLHFQPREAGVFASIDYHPDGRLVVWRQTERYLLQTAQRNDLLDIQTMYLVDENHEVASEDPWSQWHRYRPDDRDSLYQFEQIFLASGQGWSRFVGEPRAVDHPRPGVTRLEAGGSYGVMVGQWTIEWEDQPATLVRSARFVEQGAEEPMVLSRTVGTQHLGGLVLPVEGEFRLFPDQDREHVVRVWFLGGEQGANPGMEAEVLRHMPDPYPEEGEVIDHRTDPSQPRRLTVQDLTGAK
jgi:hypothetical protein